MKNQFIRKTLTLAFVLSVLASSLYAQVNLSLLGGTFPTGNSTMGVTYGNGLYVAVGYNGYILRSTDGINWLVSKNSSWLNVTYQKVCYGNGLFVAISATGTIVTSADGINWTQQVSGTANYLGDVQYLNGKFYIVGNNNVALSSTDGVTWTSFSIGTGASDNLTTVFYALGKYYIGVRASGSGNSLCYSSSTGAGGSWSAVTITAGGSLNKLQYLGNRFFAYNSTPSVYTSTDGVSWSVAGGSRLAAPNQVFTGFYDGTTYYLLGNSSDFGYCSVFTSTDGVNFSLQPQAVTITVQHAAYLNGRYFIVGNEGMVSSANGANWAFTSSSYYAVASNGTRYVAVGQNTGSEAAVQVSTDYVNWTPVSPGIIRPLNAIVYGNGQFVAVGNTNGSGFSTYAVSADGLTWTTGSTGYADALRGVAYGNNKYVAVGLNGRILYSSNGTSWTSTESVVGYNYYGVSFLNNYFIAVGGSTSIGGAVKVKYSADGVTWTNASPAITGHFHAVTYGNGKYLLVGRDNVTGVQKFFSVTTSDITSTSAYSSMVTTTTPEGDVGTLGVGAVAYGNSNFVSVVNLKVTPFSAYVLTSADGSAWTATAVNSTSRLRAVMATATGFKSLGATPGAFLSISLGVTLPLRLIDFTAVEKSAVMQLDWKVAEEINTDRFEIQRSDNGQSFTYIGEVKARNTAGENSYRYIDAEKQTGTVYYRVKMIDIDGKFTYTPVIAVTRTALSKNISIYPNPAHDNIVVSLPDNIPAMVTIFTNKGRKVLAQHTEDRATLVDINALAPGIYVLQVKQGDKTYSEKLIKQ